jgi:hypothetical protein
VRWQWNDSALTELGLDIADQIGGDVEAGAQATAPKRTGAGAASIRATRDGGSVIVGWDSAHHYLRFQDYVSSKHGHTTHFLERALETYGRG